MFELAAAPSPGHGTRPASGESGLGALFKISLLCRASYKWAHPRMYAHVKLDSPARAHKFARAIKHSPRLAQAVRSLELDGGESVDTFDRSQTTLVRRTMTARLDRILALCPNLTRVTVRRATIFALTDFSNGHSQSLFLSMQHS